MTESETLAVMWAMSHFHHYLYGHNVIILTEHSAVKTVLGSPSKNSQHVHWWTKFYGSGVKDVQIMHRAGRETPMLMPCLTNHNYHPRKRISEGEVQVCAIVSNSIEQVSIESLLQSTDGEVRSLDKLADLQQKDRELKLLNTYCTWKRNTYPIMNL